MKIDPNQEIVKTVYSDKTTGPDKPADNKFDTILSDAINNDPSETSTEKVNPQMINSISSIQLNPLFAVQDNPIVERTENFLNILEEYQNKLLDPQATLRDIHPLIERMETEKNPDPCPQFTSIWRWPKGYSQRSPDHIFPGGHKIQPR